MMLERHYDEETLIALLHSGQGSASRDPHLSSCASCTDLLDSYRVMSEVLGEKEVWELSDSTDDSAAVRGVASLRSFAATMESEDELAASLVEAMLDSPRQWWIATVERDARYQNAGTVRRLVEVSEAKIHTVPADSIELAASAIAVAGMLPQTDATLQLLGAAYRQHAYALFYVGEFVRSADSIEAAQSALNRCVVADFAVGRLNIVRALVAGSQGRYDEALATANAAIQVFRQFGERRRLASGLMTQAYLLISAHNFRAALPILHDIQQNYSADVDPYTRALTFHNIAVCHQELGDVADALGSYQIAAALYEDIKNVTEAARIRRNVALLLSTEGKRAEARKRLRACQVEFEQLGMVHYSVLAGLDLAEIALLENNFEEVEQLCHAAMRQFESAGVSYSREALIALTYLREAAEQRRATQETFWHVKTYIRRLPDQPALLFAPAPLPSL